MTAPRAFLRGVLVVLVPLCVALLGVEVLLRATHLFGARVAFTEPDPEIGFRFTPGRAYWFRGENDHAVTGRINALGWRDHARARQKPAGVRRVAVLGDSFVEALQVELDSTFVSIAERRLNAQAAPPRVEVMNFGRSGMTATEEYIVLLRDVLPCEPDAVVLLFTPNNDIADVSPATADNPMRPFPRVAPDGSISFDLAFAASRGYRVRARINPLKQRSALVSLCAERYNLLRHGRSPAVPPPAAGAVAGEQSLCTARPDPRLAAPYGLLKDVLAAMARRCGERGVEFWLMSVPAARSRREVATLQARDATFDPAFFERDLAALADTTGAGLVPLAGRFLAREGEGGEALFWAHFSYAGHRLVAEALVEALGAAGDR